MILAEHGLTDPAVLAKFAPDRLRAECEVEAKEANVGGASMIIESAKLAESRGSTHLELEGLPSVSLTDLGRAPDEDHSGTNPRISECLPPPPKKAHSMPSMEHMEWARPIQPTQLPEQAT